ncbi:hypothetical protein BN1050_02646 [Metalysinibacillus saudimassiliensis]|uniref:Uncharacterized protein n=1 Tax=Metalysinibacillus saudimassiliensis TaxID=1461583 RepID=A0A078MM13_9BACL|nr:hypothetical protein BN1050_02646 [Metalysinibacillus saudimassiliensis]
MENTHLNQEVAAGQAFFNAEKEQMDQLMEKSKEQMDQLTEKSKELAETTQMSAAEAASVVTSLAQKANELPPEVQAQLDELAAIKATQAVKDEVEEFEEALAQVNEISPEVQAQLDELAAIKAAEEDKKNALEKDPNYVKLSKPYAFEGKVYEGIKLDFDEMTGADILEAEEEFTQTKTQTAAQTPLKELSKGYLAFFAARACAQPVDFILGLDGKSFAKITRKAQNFLLTED